MPSARGAHAPNRRALGSGGLASRPAPWSAAHAGFHASRVAGGSTLARLRAYDPGRMPRVAGLEHGRPRSPQIARARGAAAGASPEAGVPDRQPAAEPHNRHATDGACAPRGPLPPRTGHRTPRTDRGANRLAPQYPLAGAAGPPPAASRTIRTPAEAPTRFAPAATMALSAS